MRACVPMGAGSLLDPEIREWLALYPAPDLDYRDVDAVRALTARYMAEQGGLAPRWSKDDVVLEESHVGGVDVLIWRPRDAIGDCPVVLAFHGGAFIVGHPLGAERVAVPLAAHHHVATVSVGYRLAPEHRAPAALRDAITVLEGLGGVSGVDATRVAVHGSSAGAALAVGVAAHARDRGIALCLQSLSCPALDDQSAFTADSGHSMQGESPTLSRESVVAMWQHYLGDTGASPDPYVVPARIAYLSAMPPAHITVAEYDVLRDEALAYAERLVQADVAVDLDLVPGSVHGFDGLLPDSAIARAAIERQVRALGDALRTDSDSASG